MENKNDYVLVSKATEETECPPIKINKLCEIGRIKFKTLPNGRRVVDLIGLQKYLTAHPPRIPDVVWDMIKPLPEEHFYIIDGYDDKYCASNKGRIVNFTSGEVLSNKPRTDGYVKVSLRKNGRSISKYAHCIIAQTQCPNAKNKSIVHHIYIGFKHRSNNDPKKLIWVTLQEHNYLHRLWDEGKKEEYWDLIKIIKRDNKEATYKISHPDYEPNNYFNYFMYVTKKGFNAFNAGKEIPLDSIRGESVELKGSVVEAV